MGDIKAYLRSIRLGPYTEGETDPFILYQDAKISKGRLLTIIENEILDYLKTDSRAIAATKELQEVSLVDPLHTDEVSLIISKYINREEPCHICGLSGGEHLGFCREG